MKKFLALTLVALTTAACDVGVAGSSSVPAAGNAGSKPAMCPTSGAASSKTAGDCGMCPSAASKESCKEACEEMPPSECETMCESSKKECDPAKKAECDSTKKECAPKAGN